MAKKDGFEQPPSPKGPRSKGLAAAIAVIVLAAFWPVLLNGFTNWDDTLYITANPHVRSGLTAESVRWALSATDASNWHPLTWVSHQIDWTLFGARAWGHHAVSLLLHLAGALVLFLALAEGTGETGLAAAAAALWAAHPLRVESVAWGAERKDVLSTLFWMLGMLAWVRWCRRPSTARYVLVAACLALGLLSKPMLVTFPFALLLLDAWPLRRIGPCAAPPGLTPGSLVLEKTPLFLLVAASSAVTLAVQRSAMPTGEALPFGERIQNAVVSYGDYLVKTVLPVGLSPFYPHLGPTLPGWQVVVSAIALAAISAGVWLLRRRAPYLAFGWLWYLGTLVPVIGLVQVGSAAMADRYTYVPGIGIAVAVVWGMSDLLRRIPRPRRDARSVGRGGAALAGAALAALVPLTALQAARWKDSITLFSHAISLDPKNPLAHNNLGTALEAEGRGDEAIAHYRAALAAEPHHADARGNLGMLLFLRGETAEAEEHLRLFLELRPGEPNASNALADILLRSGRSEEALALLEASVRQAPDFAKTSFTLSRILAAQRRNAEAIAAAERAESLGYREPELYVHLAMQCIEAQRWPDAARALEELVRAKPEYGPAYSNLAAAYEKLGRLDDARRTAAKARELGAPPPPELERRLGTPSR